MQTRATFGAPVAHLIHLSRVTLTRRDTHARAPAQSPTSSASRPDRPSASAEQTPTSATPATTWLLLLPPPRLPTGMQTCVTLARSASHSSLAHLSAETHTHTPAQSPTSSASRPDRPSASAEQTPTSAAPATTWLLLLPPPRLPTRQATPRRCCRRHRSERRRRARRKNSQPL